ECGRIRHGGRDLPPHATSLHGWTHALDSTLLGPSRGGPEERALHHPWDGPEPPASAFRMPVPSSMPARVGHLRHGRPAAGAHGRRAPRRVPQPHPAGRDARMKPTENTEGPPPEDGLLAAEDLKVHFPLRGGLLGSVRGHVHAVDGVSMRIRRGETLAVVGESGSGKTTLARVLLRLLEPTAGRVYFMGRDFAFQSHRVVRELRKHLQMVFQDPMSSLDPRMTVKAIVAEPLVVHEQPGDRPPAVMALAILAGLGGFGTFLLGLSLLLHALLIGYVGLLFLAEPSTLLGLVFVGYGAAAMSAAWGFWSLRTWAWWTLFVLAIGNLLSWVALTSLPGFVAAAGILVGPFAVRNRFLSGEKITARVLELLDLAGLKKEHLNRFPHEFSGGQRQRINIARALALHPDVIIL